VVDVHEDLLSATALGVNVPTAADEVNEAVDDIEAAVNDDEFDAEMGADEEVESESIVYLADGADVCKPITGTAVIAVLNCMD
jgi:hypothetical protein